MQQKQRKGNAKRSVRAMSVDTIGLTLNSYGSLGLTIHLNAENANALYMKR